MHPVGKAPAEQEAAMTNYVDLVILADYAGLVETGFADKDLDSAQRAEVVMVLRRTIERMRSYGTRSLIPRDVAKSHLFACNGDISTVATLRAATIIENC